MENRLRFIEKYIRDKKVLDLGCIGGDISEVHKLIVTNSAYCLGVDINKEKIEKANEQGYHVVYGNVEKLEELNLDEKFEVIVAGELIEHVSNPGKFLENIKRYLCSNGLIVITTPNLLGFRYIVRHILFKEENPFEGVDHFGHVTGFTKSLLNDLLIRHGFVIVGEIEYTYMEYLEYTLRGKLMIKLFKLFPHLSPGLSCVVKIKK